MAVKTSTQPSRCICVLLDTTFVRQLGQRISELLVRARFVRIKLCPRLCPCGRDWVRLGEVLALKILIVSDAELPPSRP